MSTIVTVYQLHPVPGYMLVKPAQNEAKTASGIILSQSSIEKPQYGTVISCGNDIDEAKCPAKKGDTVIYKKWGGSEFKVGDIEYQFLKFEDILAVIK